MSECTFPLETSFRVDAILASQGIWEDQTLTLGTDLGHLQELGQILQSRIPEQPRMLLLGEGQYPSTDAARIVPMRVFDAVPTWKDDNDIVVSLEPLDERGITEQTLLLSVAVALLKRRQRERQDRLMRYGGRTAAAGLLIAAGGGLIGEAVNCIGVGLSAVGLGAVTYASTVLNEPAKVPPLHGVSSPIIITRQPAKGNSL